MEARKKYRGCFADVTQLQHLTANGTEFGENFANFR